VGGREDFDLVAIVVDEVGPAIASVFEPGVDVSYRDRPASQELDGEIVVYASRQLVRTLMEHDLVDELRLIVFPVVLGKGKRLFGDGAIPRTWRLAAHSATPSGALIASYQRAGGIETGSMGPE
jgi:dihydrofolate reductase